MLNKIWFALGPLLVIIVIITLLISGNTGNDCQQGYHLVEDNHQTTGGCVAD